MHHSTVSSLQGKMSPDGLVTIPEAIRRATGLVPGRAVVVEMSENGDVVIMTRTRAKRRGESAIERAARFDRAFDAIGNRFSTGQTTAAIMEELRGSRDR